MKIQYALALVVSTLAFSAQAQYSENADEYAKARYGTTTPDVIYDTDIKRHDEPHEFHGDVKVGQPPAGHDVHRFESFMGDHD